MKRTLFVEVVPSLLTKNTTHTYTHTHNRFTALLDSVRDYPGEPAPER